MERIIDNFQLAITMTSDGDEAYKTSDQSLLT